MPKAGPADRATALRRAHAGDLSSAIESLRRLVEVSDDPEDRFLLGTLAYLSTDVADAQQQLELAYRDFQARHLPRRAALAATALARVHLDLLDDRVVGGAWLARALRLLEREEPCVEKGYALVALFGAYVDNADELEGNARAALDIAHQFQDANLECKALGDSGLALVSMGRVRDGMQRLDEAFAMVAGGECTDPAVISQVFCGLMSACERCGDAARAEAWLRVIETRSPHAEQGPSVHLFAHCWTALGGVLCHVGRWQEAEMALRMGLAKGESSYHFVKLSTRASLADLWIRQGRLDEAARLIDEHSERVEVLGPRARLYLSRLQYDLAVAVARQALRQLGGDRLRRATLLVVLVEAELGRGHPADAAAAARELEQLANAVELPAVTAEAALALGKVAMAQNDREQATRYFEAGLAVLGNNCPPLRAALHLELARAYTGDAPAEALVHAEAAFRMYRRLGCAAAEVAAELLRLHRGPVPVVQVPHAPLDALSKREREVLALLAEGLSNPAIARRLFITPKTAEHHVSSILAKLGLRSRAEAAAFAASFHASQPRWGCE